MIRKYHTNTLQTNPRHHEEEPPNIYSNKTFVRQLKQRDQLSLSLQDDCETRMDTKMHNKTKTNTEPPQTMGSTLNNRSSTTEPPPENGQQPRPLGELKCIF